LVLRPWQYSHGVKSGELRAKELFQEKKSEIRGVNTLKGKQHWPLKPESSTALTVVIQ
jgi:hypothetical protein